MDLTQEQRDKFLSQFDAYLASRADSNTLRERNTATVKRHLLENKEMRAYRSKMKKRFKIDPMTESDKFPVMKPGFSWTKFRESLQSKLREADSESAFPLFLVAGVLQNVIGMYQLTKMSYMDWVTITPTDLVETPIAPLHGLSFPNEVGPQMPYREVHAAAMSMKIRVRKYGSMYSVEQELLEDDQTGQFKQQTGLLGEYLQLLTEVLVYGKLASVSGMAYNGFVPPKSETQPSTESNWPWTTSSATFVGGGYNKPTSYGTLTQANIQTGITALMEQNNLLGINMNVNPDRILISPKYRFDAAVLLNSGYYPSGAAAAGVVGGAFAINPIQGIADLSISRLMPNNSGVFGNLSSAWYLVDSKKPFFQLLTKAPVSVEQENPQSGESFSRDIYRFKCRTRIMADFIDPRFAWQGSDGSV